MSNPLNSDSYSKGPGPWSIRSLLEKLILRHVQPMVANYETTLLGVGILLTQVSNIVAALHELSQGRTPSLERIDYAAIMAGIAALRARDANKSSQDSGVR